jgi:hypothetical protein
MPLLLAGGVSVGMVRTQLEAGNLLRLRRGVYLAASAWPVDVGERHVVLARAEVVANPAAVISHQSAAQFWELPTPGFFAWSDRPVAVTFPAGQPHSARSGTADHHLAELPPEHVARDTHGYAVTTLSRTAMDLVRGLELPAALVILDAVSRRLCERFVTMPRRSDYSNPKLAEAAREDLRRVARTRPSPDPAPMIDLADPARESVAESLSAAHFELSGLPRPQCQARLVTPRGTFYPDFFWQEQNLIGECDGAVKYGRAGAYEDEKEREQALRDVGFQIVRWLAKEIMARPDVVVDRVARKLAG